MATESKRGWFVNILHLHIPFVIDSDTMAREWLFQATAESYIPLLNIMSRLIANGKSPKLTLGITPPLAEQLASDHFREAFTDYLHERMESALHDALFFRNTNIEISYLARRWEDYYWSILYAYEKFFNRDILGVLRRWQDEGHIELIASAATHAFMPLLSRPSSIRAQVSTGVETYERHFGRRPAGFWLPECAYRPGLENYLDEQGIRYFIVDSRQLNGGNGNGGRSVFRPHQLKTSSGRDMFVLSRHFDICSQVWDHSFGYPGDPNYLDFHKTHLPSKLRYWRVTSREIDMSKKEIYRMESAFYDRKEEHARHYVEKISGILENNHRFVGRPEGLIAAFDGELFGHWWFEGVEWLHSVIEKIHNSPGVGMATASEMIERVPADPDVHLIESSWSDLGAHENWLRGEARESWNVIHAAEQNMENLASAYCNLPDKELAREILCQAAREMLLLQSSDWIFMLTTGNTPNIARDQIRRHSEYFTQLGELAEKYCRNGDVSPGMWSVLQRCSMENWIFPKLSMDYWCAPKPSTPDQKPSEA